jgi:hypothetical protein
MRPHMLDPADPLDQLNEGFLEYYAARQRAVLAALGPALACVDDWMYLRIGGQRFVGLVRPRLFHDLKVLCHLPLAIQAILGDAGGEPDAQARARLFELDRRTAAVADGLADRDFDSAQLERQRRIIAASRAFMARTLALRRVGEATLHAFLRDQTPDIRLNLADATSVQLTATHAIFGEWVDAMSVEQWSQLRVVVGAAHMARTGNLASQYFTLALGDRWEGRFETEDGDAARRVLTSEDATDEQTAFALLATHAFDRRAANAFFGEEGRLGRDVMADAAEQQLAAMFGARPKPAE